MQYRIIDADSHVNEPADVWQARVPRAMKERAPKMITTEDGKVAWSFDAGKRVTRLMTAVAGTSPLHVSGKGVTPEQIRPGNHDPHARLAEMEYDMVQAQVIYPSVVLNAIRGYTERDLHLAIVRAYNDWIHEFSMVSPERLIGLPIAPMTGVEDALAEWRRVAARGARGIVLNSYPNGGPNAKPEDDAFWREVQEWPYAVHFHFGFATASAGPSVIDREASPREYLTASFLNGLGTRMHQPLAYLVFAGLFERHPKLKIVAVETGIGWIPFFLQVLDDEFMRRRWTSGVHLKRLPSEYFREHIYATFINDLHGIENRHAIGVDHIMWSTDYPHNNSDWPQSQRFLRYELRGVPEEERRMILRDNAARMYGLDLAQKG